MITIQFAGEKIQVENTITLTTLLAQNGYADTGYAVAVNLLFIPAAHYAVTALQEKDTVDIITPMQGG